MTYIPETLRPQAWVDHFRLDGVTIAPLSPEGG